MPNDAQQTASTEMTPTAQLGLAGWLVLGFVVEGLLAKSLVPGVPTSLFLHMAASAGFLALLATLLFLKRGRDTGPVAAAHHLALARGLLLVFIAYALVSSIMQPMAALNVVFWSIWAANWCVMWWGIPKFFSGWSTGQRIRLLAWILYGIAIACVLLHPIVGTERDRLRGMFVNATFSGRFLALACIVWTVRFLTSDRRLHLAELAMGPLVGTLLLMTRTRTALAAAAAGCAVATITAILSGRPMAKKRAAAGGLVIFASLVLVAIVAPQHFDLDRTTEHLRIDQSWEDVFAGRMNKWSHGYESTWHAGMFGEGFLSKFTDQVRTVDVMGFWISIPKYDWTAADDPHNMFFTTAQQQGIPNAIVLLALVAVLIRASYHLDYEGKCLLRGWLAAGILFGCLQGNWLTTFGNPVDRISMLALGLLLSTAPAQRIAQILPASVDTDATIPTRATRSQRRTRGVAA